jgi:cellulose synthase/poly-beta-1,6-N-acetylglucosamine synthase-like glycosyltransferase
MVALNTIDWLFFIILALCTGYLLFYAIASLFYRNRIYPETSKRHRFLVLFPAYAEDSVIISSIQTFLQQNYPKESYHVVVISDHQKDETNKALQQLPITTLIATYAESSKAKALTLAINTLDENDYDTVVVLDADNSAPANFLTELNKVRAVGIKTIQVHRKGLINQSPISILDGVSEEINNGIFRKGHQALGMSSALTGSGMAFDYNWFKQNIGKVKTAGEDKELEVMLLKQRIYITYINKLFILDKKTGTQKAIGNQRKRWIAAQFNSMIHALSDLPRAIITGNLDYADKIFQWMLPPRLIQLTLIFGITLIISLIGSSVACKWLWLSLAQIIAMIIPIPKTYWNKNLLKSLYRIPVLAIRMFSNLFKLRGVNNKFIHTKHE